MTASSYKIILAIPLLFLFSCLQKLERKSHENQQYFDVNISDTLAKPPLFAVTDEEFMQWGARVAYVSINGDTIIPFGKYCYYGTDTLIHYADVLVGASRERAGRQVGINRYEKILFDLTMFDNGPDPFHEGLVRVSRNGKMGYANKFGQVVIPCIYDCVGHFDGGVAQVTFDATWYTDGDHTTVESDEWFEIDKKGQKIIAKK